MKIIDESNFREEVIKSKVPVLVDFFAYWCGPCRMLHPTLESMSDELGESAKIFQVDIDKNPKLTLKYNVIHIPTLLFFNDGKLEKRLTGVQNKALLTETLQNLS